MPSKKMEETLEFSNRRWKNRRRMTWITLISTLVATFSLFFMPVDKIEALVPLFSYFYVFSASIIGCYIGFATQGDRDDNAKLLIKDPSDGE